MRVSEFAAARPVVRFAVLGVIAVSASACSQADRFAYDPFSNPFNGRETTGSVSAAPSGGVSSQPLPPPGGYQSSGYTAPAYAPQQPQQQFPYSQPQSQPYRQAAYTPTPAPQRMAPPTPLPQYQAQPAEKPGWSAQSGRRVTVQAGDTAYGLGARYGVPASAILQANNLPPGAQLNAGQSIVIPGYHGPSQAQVQPNPPVKTAKPKPAPASSGDVHTVRSGDTLYSIAREYNVSPRELADANNVGLDYRVRQGESISLPRGQNVVARAEVSTPKIQQPVYRPEENTKSTFLQSQPEQPKQQPVVARAADMPSQVSGGTDFRWPVRGRVISGFGQKPNGQTNDGVNISVPEGTEIKAAEGGVVAYAGNQLKGFGNLVLIRHQGEWVTAYAHASEILVKRGDTVRRGQVIARSGKTGNVSSPQLHFEVRKGASPVDPLNHLPNV